MRIFFNDEIYETDSADLYSVLQEKEMANRKGIAVAVNDRVITSSKWTEKELTENDKIIVITAAAGG